MILKRKFKDALAPPPLRLAHPWLTGEAATYLTDLSASQ
jgi:hypothetical protein